MNNDQNTAAVTDTSNTAAAVNSMPGASVNGAARAMRVASTTRQDVAGKLQAREQQIQAKAAQEIAVRVDSLNKLSTRIQSMKNLSASQIASFQTTIQAAITDMTSLGAKIQSDTSTTSLAADLKSIAPDYRIYMLVEPQISILSAADRVNAIVATLQTLETKIQTRLASSTASNLTALQADLTDMTAKLADASTQSAAASAEVTGLMPDNGDKTVMAANAAALKDARSKIQAATKDIQAAYKDAQAVVKGVRGTAPAAASNPVSTGASASTTTQ